MPLDAGDIAQIINLGHEYNQAVDRHDPQAWTETYTADGELRSAFGNPKGRDADDAPPAIFVTGGYDDELVRVDGRWRFARRVHQVDPSYGGVEPTPPA
jgi:SnoaL-like domain